MADVWVRIAGAILVAWLLGAVPFALIVGKVFYKTDPRAHGSGNLGATNVFRVLGARAGVAVFALDVAKGALAVVIAGLLSPEGLSPAATDGVLILAAFAAILGHSFSPYIGFKGGKGVAVAAGALLVVTPLAVLILFSSFIVVVLLTRIVSFASVLIAAAFPALCFVLYRDRPAVIGFSFVAAALVIWRHRANIGRIRRGEEARISWSRRGVISEGKDNTDREGGA